MGRIMIAGTGSGSGKTTITCAIVQALKNYKKKVACLKCGPDYIDPMFHQKIHGVKTGNLDHYFMTDETLRGLLWEKEREVDVAVIEGVMGFYDGKGMAELGSSCALSNVTQTPVILVVPCRGKGRSALAMLQGYLNFAPNLICGVIFNELAPSLYPEIKSYCETKWGIKVLGYFPRVKKAEIGSRHLGLITADEIEDINEKMEILGQVAEERLDIKALIEIANQAVDYEETYQAWLGKMNLDAKKKDKVRIGVAKDKAFCFYYQENLTYLQKLGCELIYFSPLQGETLPHNIAGLYLGGGYPELYAKELSNNTQLALQIREVVEKGMPVFAECGGYMYLHESISDMQGNRYTMAGVLKGSCKDTGKLQNFGYATVTAQEDNILCEKGTKFPIHEFHRYQSSLEENLFLAEKKDSTFYTGIKYKNVVAGFPHIHFYAQPSIAEQFVQRCLEYDQFNNNSYFGGCHT